MDQASLKMIENLYKNTGKTLQEWIDIVQNHPLEKHGDVIKFLKESHGLTYGFANLIAHKAKGSDAGSAENQDTLISKQYKGKEHFKPIYDKLILAIKTFGKDIEIAPKISYVSVRRKKQFALLIPATKKRFEIGINLKGHTAEGKLEIKKTLPCIHIASIFQKLEVLTMRSSNGSNWPMKMRVKVYFKFTTRRLFGSTLLLRAL